MGVSREEYLENRVKELTNEVSGLQETIDVMATYTAMILREHGHIDEENGFPVNINEIGNNLKRLEILGVPERETIKLFARERTEETE